MPQYHKNQALQRTCVGCFKKFNQGDLLAVTRLKDGSVVVDLEQALDGRSVYLCRKAECLKKTRRRKPKSGVEYGLKKKVGSDVWEVLEKHLNLVKN